MREVTARADLDQIRDLEQAVWGEDHDRLPGVLGRGLTDPDDPCVVVVAEAGPDVVCAGWIRLCWSGGNPPRPPMPPAQAGKPAVAGGSGCWLLRPRSRSPGTRRPAAGRHPGR
jgi:hypothetical protein